MLSLLFVVLSCTPNPEMICTREYSPVCADGVEYSNRCLAQAAGFVDDCASRIFDGRCQVRDQEPNLPTGLSCADNEVYSELGHCTQKPWSDFVSCIEEKNQGACSNGRDPNPWVMQHCVLTCRA